jgi:hypothetical protein
MFAYADSDRRHIGLGLLDADIGLKPTHDAEVVARPVLPLGMCTQWYPDVGGVEYANILRKAETRR